MKTYKKPALSIEQQVDQWQERGLAIPDRERAERYLNVISYYRLSAYTLPFQFPGTNNHKFKEGTEFNNILKLYIFDRQLRILVMDAIERIEVGLRSVLNNHMSIQHGSHWYLDKTHFKNKYIHNELLSELKKKIKKRQKEVFIKHYIETYSKPKFPPCWMVVEIISFGQLSMLYANLVKAKDRNKIANFFNIHEKVFVSWVNSLNYLRNLCAHHSRLWNREMAITPKTPHKIPKPWISLPVQVDDPRIKPERRIYMMLVIIRFLLKRVNRSSSWHKRLFEIFEKYPDPSRPHMGMPEEWYKDPFWNI